MTQKRKFRIASIPMIQVELSREEALNLARNLRSIEKGLSAETMEELSLLPRDRRLMRDFAEQLSDDVIEFFDGLPD